MKTRLIPQALWPLCAAALLHQAAPKAHAQFGVAVRGSDRGLAYEFVYEAPSFHRARSIHAPIYGYSQDRIVTSRRHATPRRQEVVRRIDPREESAWSLLRRGRYLAAQNILADLANDYPEDGRLHLACAIAAGRLGDDVKAIAAFRNAIAIDPASVYAFPKDGQMRQEIDLLCQDFDLLRMSRRHNRDLNFSIAVMAFLLEDYRTSRTALNRAQHLDDWSRESRNLERLLDNRARHLRDPRHNTIRRVPGYNGF